MKQFFLNLLKHFPPQWLIVLLVAIAAGLGCGHAGYAIIVMMIYAACSFLFNVGRQIYWRITKTGDYAYMQKSSETIPPDSTADLN